MVRLSESSKTITVRSSRAKGSLQMDSWRLLLAPSRDQARAEAEAYAPFAATFAYAQRDGLPLRDEASQEARRVYKLREGQVLKVLARRRAEGRSSPRTKITGTACSPTTGSRAGASATSCRCSRAPATRMAEAAALKARDPLLEALLPPAGGRSSSRRWSTTAASTWSAFSPDIGFFLDGNRRQAELLAAGLPPALGLQGDRQRRAQPLRDRGTRAARGLLGARPHGAHLPAQGAAARPGLHQLHRGPGQGHRGREDPPPGAVPGLS